MNDDKLAVIESKEKELTKTVNKLFAGKTPKTAIKVRPGPAGKTVSYVTIGYVISELNKAFGPFWEFKVVDKGIGKTQIWVQGQLTIKDPSGFSVTKETFGGADIKMSSKSGDAVDIANDLKAAVSDCTKKCASMFGIAADVFYKDMEQYEQMPALINVEEGKQESTRQIVMSKLFAVGSGKGFGADELKDKIKIHYKVAHMEELSILQMETAIKQLEETYQDVEAGQTPLKKGVRRDKVEPELDPVVLMQDLQKAEVKPKCYNCKEEFDPNEKGRDELYPEWDSPSFCKKVCQDMYYPNNKMGKTSELVARKEREE